MSNPPVRLRTLLVLGRVSNLPTVWSNCLAAWCLNGGGSWLVFVLLSGGASLLYVGGMFLNDAFDAEFDREYRPERPIPSGQISRREVWWWGGEMIFLGWVMLFLIGRTVAWLGLLLVAAILVYNAVHKRTEAAPFLMGVTRFLLYLVAGAATFKTLGEPLYWHALALGGYIVGLSFVAQRESRRGSVASVFAMFLVAPVVTNILVPPSHSWLSNIAFLALLGWILKCLAEFFGRSRPDLGKTVTGLLAGIVLVDAAAVAQLTVPLALIFAGLFLLCRAGQRFVPAT